MLTVTARESGADGAVLRLGVIGDRLADFRPVADALDPVIYDWMTERMDSEGHGTWEPLAPDYAAWKAKTYPGKPILQATGEMYDGLTRAKSKYSVRRADRDGGEWGTDAPYAHYHQEGTGRMPRRKIIEIDTDLRKGIVAVMAAHVRDTVRSRR